MPIVKLGVVQFVKFVTLDIIMDLQVTAHHGLLLILTALCGEFLRAVFVALVITSDLMAYAHHGLRSILIARPGEPPVALCATLAIILQQLEENAILGGQ
jgi:hypothetical protein